MIQAANVWGFSLRFPSEASILEARRRVLAEGYTHIETFTPFGIEEIAVRPENRKRKNKLARLTLLGGLAGFFSGVALQYYTAVLQYPINVAGRALASWPAFVPVTFELTILGAALAVVTGFFLASDLPRPYHPFFNVPSSERASDDGFFLCVEASDPLFELVSTQQFLSTLKAAEVSLVPL